MRKYLSCLLLGVSCFVLTGRGVRAQQPAASDEAQLKERVKAFYQDVLKVNRVAALDLVAADSKNQFLNNRYDGLVDFRIAGVEIDPAGERATAKVVRVIRVPNFGQPLNVEVTDTWQRNGGQWYLVLPPVTEMDTPFGKLKFDPNDRKSSQEVEEMKQRIQQHYQNVDPDQYIRALQKVAIKPAEPDAKASDKPPLSGGADSKTESKPTKPDTTTPPPADNSKPHE